MRAESKVVKRDNLHIKDASGRSPRSLQPGWIAIAAAVTRRTLPHEPTVRAGPITFSQYEHVEDEEDQRGFG